MVDQSFNQMGGVSVKRIAVFIIMAVLGCSLYAAAVTEDTEDTAARPADPGVRLCSPFPEPINTDIDDLL